VTFAGMTMKARSSERAFFVQAGCDGMNIVRVTAWLPARHEALRTACRPKENPRLASRVFLNLAPEVGLEPTTP
jgi:hypothetical protein